MRWEVFTFLCALSITSLGEASIAKPAPAFAWQGAALHHHPPPALIDTLMFMLLICPHPIHPRVLFLPKTHDTKNSRRRPCENFILATMQYVAIDVAIWDSSALLCASDCMREDLYGVYAEMRLLPLCSLAMYAITSHSKTLET